MRILIYGINYAPELTGIGKYSGEMAEWLAKSGHDVRVVTAPPYYPEWRVAKGYSAWLYTTEMRQGVSIWRCPLWIPARPSGAKRLLHLGSFALSSFLVILRQMFWRPEVVLAIEPPLFCAPVAGLCAKMSGGKAWLHVQDFEVDAAFELGILRAQWARRIVVAVEGWLMRRFDLVSTISPNMVRRLVRKGVAEGNARLFSNWVDVDTIYPLPDSPRMRHELGVPVEKFVALYSGNMGEKQGLEIVLESAARLSKEGRILFILCGDGAARSRLRQRYAGLPNVKWLPLQPLEKLNELLNMANVHLLPQHFGAEDLVMPSKLTGMLASGRPVVATANRGSQVAEVLTDCGIVVEPKNTEQFADAILQLVVDDAGRTEMGVRARNYAIKHWAKQGVMQELDKEIRGL